MTVGEWSSQQFLHCDPTVAKVTGDSVEHSDWMPVGCWDFVLSGLKTGTPPSKTLKKNSHIFTEWFPMGKGSFEA